jgi:hypothetical protein
MDDERKAGRKRREDEVNIGRSELDDARQEGKSTTTRYYITPGQR